MTANEQHEAFLARIISNPDSDAERLIYADWLTDQGDRPSFERAEFIRTQIALALVDAEVATLGKCTCPYDPTTACLRCKEGERRGLWLRRSDLRKREQQLRPGDRLYMPIAKTDYDYVTVQWQRGMIECVNASAEQFQKYGPHLVRIAPLRRVNISGVKPATTDREPGFRYFYCWDARWSSPLRFLADYLPVGHDSWRETEQECMDDLSAALIQWAKDKSK